MIVPMFGTVSCVPGGRFVSSGRHAGYDGWQRLYMEADGARYRSAADFKAAVRAAIEQAKYTIIANVGDQPSDLAGGHAERTFLLPDPFYRVP